MIDNAKLTLGERTLTLPIIHGSEGDKGIDITSLRKETGYITYDPGYGNTGACSSDITFIDGEEGILRHRGYPIEEVAEKCKFVEVAYMIIWGHFPSEEELADFKGRIRANYQLQEPIVSIIEHYPEDAHPMALLASCTVALSGLYEGLNDVDSEDMKDVVARLMAKFLGIAAYTYRKKKGKPFIPPDENLGYCHNFGYMLFGDDDNFKEITTLLDDEMNQLLIIHADHEQNCSTSSVRMVGSSQSNMYASIGAGICALWGPLHGGANQAVMEMLQRIHAEGSSIEKVLARAKDKEDPFRLMGFGHRVYKAYDPRAVVAKKACMEYIEEVGVKNPLVDIAIELEGAALADPYFVERNLYPNVDFYTGLLYEAMGIPVEMFTVLFAIGRLPGWIAQFMEMREDSETRIGRPRQIYTGDTARSVEK